MITSEVNSLRHQNKKIKEEFSRVKLKLEQANVDIKKLQQCTKEEVIQLCTYGYNLCISDALKHFLCLYGSNKWVFLPRPLCAPASVI